MRAMSVYYVTAVRTDSDGVITHLNTKKGDTSASDVTMSKSELITLLSSKDDKNTAKTWRVEFQSGRPLQVLTEDIRVVDGTYLRTDPNSTKADNLGNLPSF